MGAFMEFAKHLLRHCSKGSSSFSFKGRLFSKTKPMASSTAIMDITNNKCEIQFKAHPLGEMIFDRP
jgi:hypothetical protein